MSEFCQQLLNGVSLGAIYALIALGYTMVYGVLRFINFAHADVFMAGAFISYFVGRHVPEGSVAWGLFTLAVAMGGCALLGMAIERFAYRPLRKAPTLNVLITAIGISLFLESLGQLVFGAAPRTFPEVFPVRTLHAGTLVLSTSQLAVILVAAALMAGLSAWVRCTRMGTAMRAVALNPDAARLMGINVDAVVSLTFGIGSALAAAGGLLYALNYPSIDPLMGVMPGMKAFTAAVLGGIGSIPGAALGGLILGVVETFADGSRWSTYKDAIAFAVLIGILLLRPAGLLGRAAPEKV